MPLSLPQLKFSFIEEARLSVERVLVLGGRPPALGWLAEAAASKEVWAVDSGAEACMQAGLVPARAIGDFDSIGEPARRWLEAHSVPKESYSADKDLTDFQLALGLSSGTGGVLVTGCWGGRFDHLFSNIFSGLWGDGQAAQVCAFADETEVLVPLQGPAGLEMYFKRRPEALSLLPLTGICEGVTIQKVKWELHDVALSQAHPYAVSNVPLNDSARVQVHLGVLGVYGFWL